MLAIILHSWHNSIWVWALSTNDLSQDAVLMSARTSTHQVYLSLLSLQNAFALTFLIFNCKQLFVSALAIKEMFWNQVVESWKCNGGEDKWKSTMGQWGAFNVKNAENTLIKMLT